MTRKDIALLGLSIAGIIGGILSMIPQTSAVGTGITNTVVIAKAQVDKMPDQCEPSVCGYDAKAHQNSTHGLIALTDGGTCECL